MSTAPTRSAAAMALRVKQQIKAIKASQRQLHMDDDVYRDLLQAITGKRSAALLNAAEGAKVLDYFRAHGAVNPKRPMQPVAANDGGKRRPAPSAERAPMMARIHALLNELGAVTGEPHGMGYADAICKRNGWADAVDFCRPTDLHLVIGALAHTLRHRRAKAAVPASAPVDAR